jgi:hypothetical protein
VQHCLVGSEMCIRDRKDVANQTYIQAGCLFGKNSLEQKAVKKAWDEVGLSFD